MRIQTKKLLSGEVLLCGGYLEGVLCQHSQHCWCLLAFLTRPENQCSVDISRYIWTLLYLHNREDDYRIAKNKPSQYCTILYWIHLASNNSSPAQTSALTHIRGSGLFGNPFFYQSVELEAFFFFFSPSTFGGNVLNFQGNNKFRGNNFTAVEKGLTAAIC